MNRLLFAAARGARVQAVLDIESRCQCVNCGAINKFGGEERVLMDANSALAIHPEDEHLQYGPISTALRKQAATDKEQTANMHYLHGYFDFTWQEYNDFLNISQLTRSLFLLIMAEALADEGL